MDSGERSAAPVLFRALTVAREMIEKGERSAATVKQNAVRIVSQQPRVRLEYFEIVDPEELQPVNEIAGSVRIAGAMWVGKTRLIDNVAAVPR